MTFYHEPPLQSRVANRNPIKHIITLSPVLLDLIYEVNVNRDPVTVEIRMPLLKYWRLLGRVEKER